MRAAFGVAVGRWVAAVGICADRWWLLDGCWMGGCRADGMQPGVATTTIKGSAGTMLVGAALAELMVREVEAEGMTGEVTGGARVVLAVGDSTEAV